MFRKRRFTLIPYINLTLGKIKKKCKLFYIEQGWNRNKGHFITYFHLYFFYPAFKQFNSRKRRNTALSTTMFCISFLETS